MPQRPFPLPKPIGAARKPVRITCYECGCRFAWRVSAPRLKRHTCIRCGYTSTTINLG